MLRAGQPLSPTRVRAPAKPGGSKRRGLARRLATGAVLAAMMLPSSGPEAQSADGASGGRPAESEARESEAGELTAVEQPPTLTYVEGDVRVVRRHRTFVPDALFGAPLEPFDFVATGSESYASVRVGSGREAVRLSLEPESTVVIRPSEEGEAMRVELLHGVVSAEVEVRAPVAMLFDVGRLEAADADFALSRGVLGGFRVDAARGQVTVRVDSGRPQRLFATPERSVIYYAGSRLFENVAGAAGLPSEWEEARRAVAAASAAALPGDRHDDLVEASRNPLIARAAAYAAAEEAFNEAYRDMTHGEPAALEWMRAGDVHASVGEETIEALEGPLARLEAAREELEPLFRQWTSLSPLVPGDLRPQSVSRDRRIIVERLHTTRHLMQLFFESTGRLPEVRTTNRTE